MSDLDEQLDQACADGRMTIEDANAARDFADTLTNLGLLKAHHPCADCVRCATCRREWCPTVVDRCPGEQSWWRHPTGGIGTRDAEYCYKCTDCPGGYFQFHDDAYPACTEVPQPPHVIADDGKGWN